MAHNTAVSYVNRERRRRNNAGLVSLVEIERAAPEGCPEPGIDQQRALRQLPALDPAAQPLDRQIVISYLEEMDTAAIPEITGFRPLVPG